MDTSVFTTITAVAGAVSAIATAGKAFFEWRKPAREESPFLKKL